MIRPHPPLPEGEGDGGEDDVSRCEGGIFVKLWRRDRSVHSPRMESASLFAGAFSGVE
jgi:hypothetical protein